MGCTVCDSDHGTDLEPVRDLFTGEAFPVRRCGDCGTVHLPEPPAPSEIGRYYANASGAAMHTSPGRLFRTMRDRRIDRDLAPLLARSPDGAPVVDLGTGDGAVAARLRRHGRPVLAVDVYPPGDWPHDGIPYRRLDLAAALPEPGDLLVEGRPPRAAVLRHVLEHVHRPRALLEALRAAGVEHVMVIVPNLGSRLARALGTDWYYWDPPRHLTFFTPRTLAETARRAGFQVAYDGAYGLDELASSAHRALLLRARGAASQRLARALRPTGLLAGASSVASGPLAATVCHVVLEADAAMR